MKKPRNPVLVFLTIAFLLLLIILPPYFRKIIPKQEKIVVNHDKLVVLICKKYDYARALETVSKCKYRNNNFESTTISFKKIEVDQNSSNQNKNSTSLLDEYNYISSNVNASVEQEGLTVFVIDNKALSSSGLKDKLKDYIEVYEKQKKIYENKGYQCSVNKS